MVNDKYNKQTNKRPNLQFVGTEWISWPQDETQEDRVRLQKWIKACGRSDFTKPSDMTRSKRICSLHFVGGCGPTPQYPDPLPLFSPVIKENHLAAEEHKKGDSSPLMSHTVFRVFRVSENVQTMTETESSEEMLPHTVLLTAPVMVDIVCQNDIKNEQYQMDVS
ncbi:hypothetical protein LSH36_1366g00042 [Paralvinella palmiformis]|uniref:THAP-type domain-containing protein n=1 Tax=Paralvinella palmiformis TaxID=53620 RepID=A0AAD9MRJ0_9ANNE|nr:hypothetical protein LSH36_1366g00042 [Paralvinella palmiformis]